MDKEIPNLYRIVDWNRHFETAKTRTFNRCQRLTFKNDLNDVQYIRLVENHQDGASHFGVWIAICEWHSAQTKPREGYLTDNGKRDGIPLESAEIARLIRMPKEIVRAALERLCSPEIGWIIAHSDHTTTTVGVHDDHSRRLTPLHSTPLQTKLNKKEEGAGTSVPTFFVDLSRKFLDQQRKNFPKESCWKDFERAIMDGARELEKLERLDGWDLEELARVLHGVLENDDWRPNIKSLRGVRVKSKRNGAMKIENARTWIDKDAAKHGNGLLSYAQVQDLVSKEGLDMERDFVVVKHEGSTLWQRL